jgi:hypothetical protein
VFRLITFCISIVGFAAIVWFGVTVELGDRTLFGHLRAIGGTQEAQQLWDGTKGKVTDFVGIEAARRAEAAKEAFKHPPAKPGLGKPGEPGADKGLAVNKAPAPEKGVAVDRAAPARAPKSLPTHTQIVPGTRRADPAANKK